MSAVITIGNFDGVHRGHLALVARATAEGLRRGIPTLALTFDPHPAAVLRPEAVPAALQSLEDRVAALAASGCDQVEVLTFDADMANRSPHDFVTDVLVARFHAAHVVVGTNFRFGADAQGDVATLRDLGAAHGFTVDAVGLVDVGDGPVSSSALRTLLTHGDIAAVTRGLGRRYALDGEVVAGDGRGRTLGVPTANVAVDARRALPADGVYACWASTATASLRPAVVNIGWRPTFAGGSRTVEAHLMVSDEPQLYGQRLELAFVARIRGEERFDGPDALVARIHQDMTAARQLLDHA